jgi:hypothetical protein
LDPTTSRGPGHRQLRPALALPDQDYDFPPSRTKSSMIVLNLSSVPHTGSSSVLRHFPKMIRFRTPAVLVPCAYCKLDPAIAMMKATENRLSSDLAAALDRSMARRILAQGQVRSQFVGVAGVDCKDPAQMGLAEDNDVIEAFPADRADQSLSACPFCQGDLGAIG